MIADGWRRDRDPRSGMSDAGADTLRHCPPSPLPYLKNVESQARGAEIQMRPAHIPTRQSPEPDDAPDIGENRNATRAPQRTLGLFQRPL